MQRQFERAYTLLQVLLERFGLPLMLKAGDKIVRVADDNHVACGLFLAPRFTAVLADRTSCITQGQGGWLALPRGGLPPPIFWPG